MNNNDLATYSQAISYAKVGYNEKAFELIKGISRTNPDNLNLLFWGVYTAPNHERAQTLLDRARMLAPNNEILSQAEIWLTNERYKLPHPPGGYSLFPPDSNLAQPISSFIPSQEILPVAPPPVPQYYPAPSQTFILSQPVIVQTMPVYTCPYCHSHVPPLTNTRISTGGWITFAVLLILFFPLCWVGLFSKTSYKYCGQCGVKFN